MPNAKTAKENIEHWLFQMKRSVGLEALRDSPETCKYVATSVDDLIKARVGEALTELWYDKLRATWTKTEDEDPDTLDARKYRALVKLMERTTGDDGSGRPSRIYGVSLFTLAKSQPEILEDIKTAKSGD